MQLFDLFEAEKSQKHAAFCFGRMNPPTLGHKQLLDMTAQAAGDGDYYIFLSKTQKLPDNPLDFSQKYNFITKMFPEHAAHVVKDPYIKTIIQAAEYLYKKGYTSITYVAGSDRLPDFKKILDTYNGRGEPGMQGYYKFDNIDYVSAGDRDPDSSGLSGISASKARAAAAQGDFNDFKAKTGAGKLAKSLYDAVRASMGVEEDIAADASRTAPVLRGIQFESRGHKILSRKLADIAARKEREAEAAKRAERERKEKIDLTRRTQPGYKDQEQVEEMGGVGVIASKSQAKDPRYSMSLTKDVRPGAIKKSLRALRLAEDLKKFRKSLAQQLKDRIAATPVNLAINRTNNPIKWLWNKGDQIYSKKTGKVYTIVGQTVNPKFGPMYRYQRGEEGQENFERGQFIADKAHDTLVKIG